VFDPMSRAERFLRDNLPIAGRVLPNLFEREDDPLYPPVALREALANAFCHREYAIGGGSVAVAIYDDRLEITSSGNLHFGLTVDALFQAHESLPWNPLIARVFYRRGFIEQWGRGTIQSRWRSCRNKQVSHVLKSTTPTAVSQSDFVRAGTSHHSVSATTLRSANSLFLGCWAILRHPLPFGTYLLAYPPGAQNLASGTICKCLRN
jgi:predicted HTH transcriptional regulator